MSIADIIDATIGREGKYTNNPKDPGGPTMYGVTERVARKHGYTGDMRNLPRETAVAIYRDEYLVRPGFADIAAVSEKVAEELFDTGVNMGPSVPSLWFQQCLNALNNQGSLYPDIKEDGDCGPGTVAAFKAYLKGRGADAESVMLKALNGLQAARYIDIARGRAASESFLYGWLRTRVGM